MPVGVAAIITAGNFPVAVPSWYLVPALLCGNAVVWKPAEYTPAIAAAFTELFAAGGLPDGVLNTVLADGPATFDGLTAALDAGLVQTRSASPARRRSGCASASWPGGTCRTPCLELGGKNPLVVMPDADLELAVEGALFSGFGTAGQRCTSLGTVIVHDWRARRSSCARFDAAVALGRHRRPDPDDVLYGPMISERFLDARSRGIWTWSSRTTPLHGSTGTGRITADNPREGFVGDPCAGLYAHPTIVDGVRPDDELYRTETFGPIVGVARFDDLRRGGRAGQRARLRAVRGDLHHRRRCTRSGSASGCRAGMVSVNNSTSGAEAHLPFGGNGRSGNGSRQSGIWVLDQFTRWQSMNWDYAGKLQKAQMDTADLPADLDFRL